MIENVGMMSGAAATDVGPLMDSNRGLSSDSELMEIEMEMMQSTAQSPAATAAASPSQTGSASSAAGSPSKLKSSETSEDKLTREAAELLAFEKAFKASAGGATVGMLFWKRCFFVLRLAVGRPQNNPVIWTLMTLNLTFQVIAGWVAQSLFYYVGTGSGSSDPGLAGLLKSGNENPGDYSYYFNRFTWTFIVLVALVCLFSVIGDVLNAIIRRKLNKRLHTDLMNGHILYRIQLANQIDNFDQRITSDAQALLDGLSCALFGNTADYLAYPVLFCFSRICFSFFNVMQPPHAAVLESDKQFAIVVATFAMAGVTMAAYMLPMNYISELFYVGQKFEGDFRSQHAKSVLNSEQICLYNGEAVEGENASRKYENVYRLHKKYYLWQGALMFLRLICSISQPSVAYLMLAITGASDVSYASGFLKQMGDVLEYLLYLPAIVSRLAFAAGAAHRVGQLIEGVEQMKSFTEAQKIASQKRQLQIEVQANSEAVDFIELRNITASPPLPPPINAPIYTCASILCGSDKAQTIEADNSRGMKRPLFENINLKIQRGESLVIMGQSGCGQCEDHIRTSFEGKSSLLRVIGGLWPVSEGAVIRPKNTGKDGLFFLPQKSYVFPGSLCEQITYPLPAYSQGVTRADMDRLVKPYLEELDLLHLLTEYGWDAFLDWNAILSSSERQRLSFIRLFFHKPWFCLADESTSCLDLKSEKKALTMCERMNITLISVAHRPSVIAHHRNILEFEKANRTWHLKPVTEEELLAHGHDPHAEDSDDSGSKADSAPKIPSSARAVAEAKPEGLNMRFIRRFWRTMQLVLNGAFAPGTMLLLAMFILMGGYGASIILTYQYLKADDIVNKIVGRTIMSNVTGIPEEEVVDRDTGRAMNISGYYLGINVISAVLQALSATAGTAQQHIRPNLQAHSRSGAFFGIFIQRAVVQTVHKDYFGHNVLYTLNNGAKKLEGIDGRIVSDANAMREALAWMYGNPFAYLNFRLGLFPLAVSFFMCLGYAFSMAWGLTLFVLGSIIAALGVQVLSGHFTSQSMNRRQQAEGVLRQHYARVKNSIESITFFGGLESELAAADLLLDDVYEKRMDYAWRAAATVFPTVAMYYWLSNGEYVMAAIIQVYSAFPINPKIMLNTLSFCVVMGKVGMQLVQSMGGLGILSAYTHRISDVMEQAEAHRIDNLQVESKRIKDENHLGMRNASIIAGSGPAAHTLVKDLDFTIERGSSVLIMGPSACGKSSVHRAIAGLWDIGNEAGASVTRPANIGQDGIFFVSQSNYVTEGSLAEQIIYPHRLADQMRPDSELEQILIEVGLPYLVERWGLHTLGIEWGEVLSGGEAQRLGVARLLYHSPRFACVDECTSALDLKLEDACMLAMKKRNITLLSVATRLTQKSYHDRMLYLEGNGSYAFTDLRQRHQAAKVQPIDAASSSSGSSSYAPEARPSHSHSHSHSYSHHPQAHLPPASASVAVSPSSYDPEQVVPLRQSVAEISPPPPPAAEDLSALQQEEQEQQQPQQQQHDQEDTETRPRPPSF